MYIPKKHASGNMSTWSNFKKDLVESICTNIKHKTHQSGQGTIGMVSKAAINEGIVLHKTRWILTVNSWFYKFTSIRWIKSPDTCTFNLEAKIQEGYFLFYSHITCVKLRRCGVSGELLLLICSFLSNHKQRIVLKANIL